MNLFRFGRGKSHLRRHIRPAQRRLLAVEALEDRTLLSATPGAAFELLGKPAPAPQYQWDMTKISAPTAWNTTLGSTEVTVADIDSGIDYTHPDLYLNVWINQEEIPSDIRANLTDVDADGLITFWDLNQAVNQDADKITDLNGNGRIDGGDLLYSTSQGGWADGTDQDPYTVGSTTYNRVDDLIGWNFVTDTNNPFDDHGHGTHTAGTIGAIHNGIGNGIDGVAGLVQLMALKAFDQDGGGTSYDVAIGRATAAIYYAAANGARVSNNSWGVYGFNDTPDGTGGPASHQALYDAIEATPNVLFVASAGNNGLDNDTSSFANYPSSFNLPNIIAVAATGNNDQKAPWSNYGTTTVDLGAPGANVVSTVPGGYASYSGTSMAAPHVAGAAVLILAQNPGLTVAQVKAAILGSVDVMKSLSRTVSKGRLNVARALNSASALTGGDSTSAGSGMNDSGANAPRGYGKGLIQGQAEFGTVDEGDATVVGQGHPAVGATTVQVTVVSGDAFRFSVATQAALPTSQPLPPGPRWQARVAHYLSAYRVNEPALLALGIPSGDGLCSSATTQEDFSRVCAEWQGDTTPTVPVPNTEDAAPSLPPHVPINEVPPSEPVASVSGSESESGGSCGPWEAPSVPASKLTWLAGAILSLIPGALLGNPQRREAGLAG